MTDQELIEAAAKAAGLMGEYYPGDEYTNPHMVLENGDPWMPFEDNAAAFSLMVALKLQPVFVETHVACGKLDCDHYLGFEYYKDHGDVEETTRYAIVKSAAALFGKTPNA